MKYPPAPSKSEILAAFALGIGTAALTPYVLTFFWAWFVSPLGVRPVGYFQVAGLCMLLNLATRGTKPAKEATGEEKEEKEKALYNAAVSFFGLLLAWGLGWLLSP